MINIIRGYNSVEGTIEEIAKVIIDYIIQNKVETLGLGERLHETWAFSNVAVPYFLEPLVKIGFKDLVFEIFLKDIPRHEWIIVHRELEKYSRQDSIAVKVEALKTLIFNNSSQLSRLHYNFNLIVEDPDSLLLSIIKAYDLGINISGMLTSDDVKGATIGQLQHRIKAGGEDEILKLLKRKVKFVIFGGDVHLNSKPLQPSNLYPTASEIMFGHILFAKSKYLNLTIINGTVEIIEKEKHAFGERGYQFYRDEFNTLKPGQARIFFNRAEDEHRILLLYNDSDSRTS